MATIEDIRKQKLLEELRTRSKKKWVLEDILFDKQLSFVKDPAKFKTAVCSRRSGKSVSCAADLVDTALKYSNSNQLYLTLNRQTAKRLVWKEILQFNRDYDLGIKENATDLTFTFPNGAMIYCSGAAHEEEIEKFRGMSNRKVYLDEVQSFKPWIKELIDDVIEPTTWDTDGSISAIGTPGPMPSGYFYEISHSEGWSNHKWTIFDNPHILLKSGKTPEQILEASRKRRGITESDPSYRREALGQWVYDTDSLVFKYDAKRNHYVELPKESLIYIFGVDIGYVDADAIAVLGYSRTEKKVYLVEEYVKSKQDITDLARVLKELIEVYKPVKIKLDAGAIGKKTAEEIKRRHQIPVEAADKQRKFENIELMNDDLRTGRFRAKRDSRFADDCAKVEWDVRNKDRLRISDVFHSDICDAVLYAWRECYHHFSNKIDPLDMSLDAIMDRKIEEQAEKLKQQQQSENSAGLDNFYAGTNDW